MKRTIRLRNCNANPARGPYIGRKTAPDHQSGAALRLQRLGIVYWVNIVSVLDRVFGNGMPRKFGLVVEVLKKMA